MATRPDISPGLIIAALTTVGAFCAFVPSRFDFLSQMGQLTAGAAVGIRVEAHPQARDLTG